MEPVKKTVYSEAPEWLAETLHEIEETSGADFDREDDLPLGFV